jgi:hypothetical protein
MNKLRNLRVYNKLQRVFNTARLINEDIEAEKRPFTAKDAPPKKDQYGDKRAVVANLAKVTKRTNRENSFIIEGSLKITKKAEETFKETEFSIKEIVVDLTKLKNEIEQYNSSKAKDIEELKKVMRYFVTYKNQTEKAIQEAEQKKQRIEQELEKEGYFSELDRLEDDHQAKLDALRDKYDAEALEDAEMEVGDELDKQREGMKSIQEKHLGEIRKIRQFVKETVDLPLDILHNVKIYAMALGALTQLSKNPDRMQMSKEGIDKILNTPELKKELGEFIETIEYQDSVNIVSSKLPQLGTYYSEMKTKYETEMKSFEQAKDQVDEGVFSDVINQSMDKFVKRGKAFFNKAKSVLSTFISKITTDTDAIYNEVEKMILGNADFKTRFSKLGIKLNADVKKVQFETSKQTADEVQ